MIGNALPIPWLRSIYSSSGPSGPKPFILKIDTNNTFGGPSYPFGINTDSLYTYDYTVDWGDGTITSHTGNASHTYSAQAIYEVKISGECPWIKQWTTSTGVNYVIDILQWGDLEFKSLKQTFKYCNSLANPDGSSATPGIPITATDTPKFASDFAFDGLTEWAAYTQITSIPNINTWQLPDTLTSLEECFNNMKWWNDSISNWSVSHVGNFKSMFFFCREWTNSGDDLDGWEVGKNYTGDLNFESMFYYCDKIEDIKIWKQDLYLLNINFINTKFMFYQCEKWKLELENWDNSSVKINELEGMFYSVGFYYAGNNSNGGGRQYTDEGLKTDFFGWDFNTNKTSLRALFSNACFDATFNANLDGHTATNITDFDNMFANTFICSPTSVDNWVLGNTPNITMRYTFSGRPFNRWPGPQERRALDWKGDFGSVQTVNGWDVSNVIDFDGCFNSAQFDTGPDDCKPILGSWTICTDPTVNVSLSRMFRNSQFNDTLVNDINKWDLSSVTSIFEMFGGSGGVRFNQSLSNWDTSTVTNMAQFVYYNAYFNQDISHFNMLNVTNINRMFDKTQAYSYGFDWMQIPLLTGNNERFQYQWKFDTQKYTDMLNAWGAYYYGLTTPPTGVTLGMNTIGYWGLTQYFIAGLNTLANGMTTREYMVTPTSSGGLGWTITDGGGV
jgi:hypothetical protein